MLFPLILCPAVSASQPSANIDGVTIIGHWSDVPGVASFKGIPFAEPPLADLRWRAPKPNHFKRFGTTFNADKFAPACMQSPRILDWYRSMASDFGYPFPEKVFPPLAVSEDCLYLNIWTPALDHNAHLPVLVYIHGGSNKSGWSYEPNYHGHALAKQGAVVISVAYRLGVFGFFSHPELNNQAVSANFALYDIQLALQWIQQHIAAFGGDARNITLFGESAGAQNIAYLMASPQTQGMLHKAILQSAPLLGIPSTRTLIDEQKIGSHFAKQVLIESEVAPNDEITALRAMPPEQLLTLAENHLGNHDFRPIVDGQLISAQLHETLLTNPLHLQALIIGTNGDEYLSSVAVDASEGTFKTILKNSVIQDTAGLIDDISRQRWRQASARLLAANRMLCPAQFLATTLSSRGIPVWMYYFDRVRKDDVAERLGAYHGAELPYVFDTHDIWLPTDDVDRQLTSKINRLWLNFANNGLPEDKGTNWPLFLNPINDERFQLLLGDEVKITAATEKVLCRAFLERAKSIRDE